MAKGETLEKKDGSKDKSSSARTTGKINYSIAVSNNITQDIYNYLKQQDDIKDLILSLSDIDQDSTVEQKQRGIEHPSLTFYLLNQKKHILAIQKIYKNYEIIVTHENAITHNETIRAKKLRVKDLVY